MLNIVYNFIYLVSKKITNDEENHTDTIHRIFRTLQAKQAFLKQKEPFYPKHGKSGHQDSNYKNFFVEHNFLWN